MECPDDPAAFSSRTTMDLTQIWIGRRAIPKQNRDVGKDCDDFRANPAELDTIPTAMSDPTPPRPVLSWRRRLLRLLLLGVVAAPVAVVLLWVLMHAFPGLAPVLANGLRAVIGAKAVTKLEETAYGLQDRWNLAFRSGEKPKSYWDVPSSVPAALPAPAASGSAADATPTLPPFRPKDPGPMFPKWAAPGDGMWMPIVDPRRPSEATHLFKMLLHPDPTRSWAEVFLVAVDLRNSRLVPIPGYQEPQSETKEGNEKMRHRTPARPAVIPSVDHEELLGGFNGGFRAEHGHWGMMVGGVTLLAPRAHGCTIAAYPGDKLRIGTWTKLADTRADMVWFRQAPPCMAEDGKLHPGLVDPGNAAWGATIEGDTVIRRSAIGLDATGEVLFVAITNSTTAKALATAMQQAGAANVAQLDVNWSYPKFLLFEPDDKGQRKAVPLAKGFKFDADEYIRDKAMRDFFYLVRKEPELPKPLGSAAPVDSTAPAGSVLPPASAAPSASAAP